MVNHHVVSIAAAPGDVFRQLVLWGESEWWPGESPMSYKRITEGDIGVGTRYRQKVRSVISLEWDVEIISLTEGREVSAKFLNGMFEGVYRLYVIPEENHAEAHFMMDYRVKGAMNRLMWRFFFMKRHDRNIEKILLAMKGYIEGGVSGISGNEDKNELECRG
ncbi:MAG: hypothetical protein ABSG42_08245 [Nitrospirota bacterium]